KRLSRSPPGDAPDYADRRSAGGLIGFDRKPRDAVADESRHQGFTDQENTYDLCHPWPRPGPICPFVRND
ncbi:MAG: hypothetical protein ABL881_12500, partial [Novosphingobium sp.]